MSNKTDITPKTLDMMLKSISLPKRYYNSNLTIDELFSNEATAFLSIINNYQAAEVASENQATTCARINRVKALAAEVVFGISRTFSCLEASDYCGAQVAFDAVMDSLKDSLFTSTIDDVVKIVCNGASCYTHIRITPGRRFYRIRPSKFRNESIQQNPDELFHTPRSKRAHISNARFSLAGFPCLYLSSMLPLAWQECKYPKSYYYSEYQYQWESVDDCIDIDKELRFLTLYSPQEIRRWGVANQYNHFDLWLEVVARYLEAYPLVLACSFVNRSGDTPFKQEYIISQMLMQWVHRNVDTVQGVSYFTCAEIHNMTSQWCAYNVAIPAITPLDEKGYSKSLREKFTWSRPTFHECPITIKQSSSRDREWINQFIDEIRSFWAKKYIPPKMDACISKFHSIACFLLSFLEHGESLHMELAIQTVNLIEENARNAAAVQVDRIIEDDRRAPNHLPIDEDTEEEFQELYNKFIGNGNSLSIISVVNRWRSTVWNDNLPSSTVFIYFLDEKEIEIPRRLLHDNHYLYYVQKIDRNQHGIETILEIMKDTGYRLDLLWKTGEAHEELTVDNIEKLNFPFFCS